MPSHISENIAGHMSQLEVYMSTHPGANIGACMALMVGIIQKVSIENIHTHSQLQEAKKELRVSQDQLCEAHDQLCELRQSRDKLLKSQNEANQKLEQSQEKIAQLERAMTTHNTHSEKQEKRIDSQHVAMTQSYEKVSQQVSGLQESLAQQKDELTMMIKASEKKLETNFQRSLATSERKFQSSLVTSEEKLRRSLVTLQTKCSDETRQLRQSIIEQERRQTQREAKMERMTEKMREIKNRFQESLAVQQTTILAKCTDKTSQLRQAISEQERKQQENKATVIALKNDIRHQIATCKQNILDIRTQQSTLSLHQKTLEKVIGTVKLPFVFTLTEFKSKKEIDYVWYSPPFYTHTHGYRMCITVNANGNGDGKGTHLSVYAHLMEGPFDDYLEWPFQGTITFQLLNQLKDINHHTYTIDFTKSTDPKVFSRVTSGGRDEVGFGYPTFLPHTELDLKSKDDCQYLKDDQLKFQVSS